MNTPEQTAICRLERENRELSTKVSELRKRVYDCLDGFADTLDVVVDAYIPAGRRTKWRKEIDKLREHAKDYK